MGSSSKKHKKDSKKKKHRSRSPLSPGEKERKHHKKHKDRKRDRSPDVEEVPVDSHLVERNGDANKNSSIAQEERSRDRHAREEHSKNRNFSPPPPRERARAPSPPAPREKTRPASPQASGSHSESLSIEETNRLRAKLGLKPLEVQEKQADDGKIKDDLGEFYHKPATNLAEQQRTDKLKEKLKERKEKRQLEQRLLTGSVTDTVAATAEDDDAASWVNKSRAMQKQKEEAAKRAAMLDEMDDVFGVSALVAAEERDERAQSYTARNLRGLRVAHDTDHLAEGHEVVLTLQDKNVLDDDKEDVLVNVNIIDDEKYKKNIDDRKKAKKGYQAYEDEDDAEAAALGIARPVLAKYDEEIHQGKAAKDRGFVIGDEDALEAKKFRQMMIKERLGGGGGGKRLESLILPSLRLASDYMDEHEINTKFKKPKKRGKMRKKAKAEPIDVDEYDPSTAPLDTDDTDVKPNQLKLPPEQHSDEETEPDSELQVALARARRLRQAEMAQANKIPKVEDILERVKEEEPEEMENSGTHIVLDATAEFCRTLGDIPTYGLAGNRDNNLEIMELDANVDDYLADEAERITGAWSRVDTHAEKPPDITAPAGSGGALEAEPALGAGVGGALQLALSKGYLEKNTGGPAPRASQHRHLLQAKNYSIDDKAHGEDDKYARRGGGDRYCGPLQDFREKTSFKPNVKLDYVDDEGRPLCPKEAFRYLSHKFHGKGPGKNKQEKRIKKAVQEGLMKKMSSTDTPLGTLSMLQDKQKETQSPFIVLSGAKRDPKN